MDIVSLTGHPEHTRQIAAWYYSEWVDPTSEKTIEDVDREISERLELGRDIPHYYIALENDRLVGVVELKYRESRFHPQYVHWLGGLYVKQDYRCMGVGSKLIEFDKHKAVELGVVNLYLQCERRLVEFYKDHSFFVCDEGSLGPLETTIMVCNL